MRKSKLHFWIFFFFILSLFSTVSQAKIDCSIDEAAHQAIEETKARFTELFGELQLTIESGDSHGATSIPRSGDGAYSYQSNAYNDVVVSPQAHTILPPPSVSAQKISRGGFVSIDDSKFAKDQQGYFPMPAVEVVMPDYSKPLKDMYHDTGLFRPAGDNSSYALPLMKDSSGRYLDKPVPAGHKEDVYYTGPEVIKIVETLKLCKEMSSYPFVSLSMPASVCAKWKSAYKIPDDFMQRVYSLEQSYRDSAAAVIRHRRAHFPDPRLIRGNAAVDGNPREIGLDYLQGENAVWLPDEQIFGSHDI